MSEVDQVLIEAEGLYLSGAFSKALQRLKSAKEVFRNVETSKRAYFHRLTADILLELGRYKKARSEVMVAYNLLRRGAVSLELARTQRTCGWVHLHLGEISEGERCFHDTIGTLRCIEDKEDVSRDMLACLDGLAFVSHTTSCWSEALKHLQQGLEICCDIRNRAVFLRNVGEVYLKKGDWFKASTHLKEGLKNFEQCNDLIGICQACISLGRLASWRRQREIAKEYLDRANSISIDEGFRRELALTLEAMGEKSFAEGEYKAALGYFQEALKIGDEIAPHGGVIGQTQRKLAELYFALGKFDEAEAACGRALEIARSLGDRFEEGCAFRIRGLIAGEKESPEACQFFDRSIQQLKVLGERYELSKSMFAKGVYILNRFPTEREEGLSLLGEARKLLDGELDADYDRGIILVEEARWRMKNAPKEAWRPLREAESVFQKIQNQERLNLVAQLKEDLKKAESRSRKWVMDQYELLRRLSEASDRETGKLFKALADQLGADRGVFAFRIRDRFQLDGYYGMSKKEAGRLMGCLARDLNGLSPGDPVFCDRSELDKRFPSLHDEPLVNFMLIPLGNGDGTVEAVLYLDRLDGRGYFTQQMVDLFGVFGKILAGRLVQKRLRDKVEALEIQVADKYNFHNIVGQSQEMRDVIRLVKRLGDCTTSVLIVGETGVGKELVAKAIHHSGRRMNKLFIPVDCGAIPDHLLESELFGHKKGAFTDAKEEKRGLFEEAQGGTLFLDEIGDMPLHLQGKLRRALEEKKIRRVGENTFRDVDVRVLAATNKDLEAAIEKGEFRRDLYHRLGIRVTIPPLRERKGDVIVLASHFLALFSARLNRRTKRITSEAERLLMSYDWPGNVRELENVIERAVVLSDDDDSLGPEMFSKVMGEKLMGRKRRGGTLREEIEIMEKERILVALGQCEWNRTKVARSLGLSRYGLRNKMERYGIEVAK